MIDLKSGHLLAVLAALTATGCAQGLQPEAEILPETVAERAVPAPVDLDTWDRAALYAGFRAKNLLDSPVYGADGNQIGNVEHIIVGPNGRIQAIIVEAGAFLDIGGTSFRVPWDQVQLGPDLTAVTVPVTADNLDRYSVFQGVAAGPGQPRAFRASEVIGDYVRLEGDVGFGLIDDLIFSREGELLAVAAIPDVGFAGAYGYPVGVPYTFPYYGFGFGFDPGLDTFGLPYTAADVGAVEPFDYGPMDAGV